MGLSLGTIRMLLPSAFTVALLVAIESLLSAVVGLRAAGKMVRVVRGRDG